MPCYHPKKGFILGINAETGKQRIWIKPYETDCVYDNELGFVYDYVEIPCGKCLGCRLQYSQEWANRMMMEKLSTDSAYFITLTYDDDHLPHTGRNGDVGKHGTLCKKDLQLFWKHLRDKFPNDNIRYYACGEYGSTTYRPHYHAIVFGLHLDDLKPYKITGIGDQLYNSQKLQNAWSRYKGNDKSNNAVYEPIGYAVVAEVTWETCAYCARYVTKGMSLDCQKFIDENDLDPPFCVMSRHGGIGKSYYENHPDIMKYEFITLPCKFSYKKDKDGNKVPIKFRPPKYFEKLYEKDDEENYKLLKEKKKEYAMNHKEMIMSQTDLDWISYLKNCEDSLKKRIKALDRKDI